MKTLAIVLGSLFVLGCGSEHEELYELDVHVTGDGIYGTFTQGDLVVDFASFEIEPGRYEVTLVSGAHAIDVFYLPPERLPPPTAARPNVHFGRSNKRNPGDATFLLPPEDMPPPTRSRPIVHFGRTKKTNPGDVTFLLPPDKHKQPEPPRGNGLFDGASSGGGRPDIDIGHLGRELQAEFPHPRGAVEALIHVAEQLGE